MIKNIRCCFHYPLFANRIKFIEVKNLIHSLQVFFQFKYIYRGQLVTTTSKILGVHERARAKLYNSSTNRELTIYKNTGERPIFIFHTIITNYEDTCFQVIGLGTHPIVNRVPC